MNQALKDRIWYKIPLKELTTNGNGDKLMHYQNKARGLYDEQLAIFERGNHKDFTK
jgi:hypothetical protein